MATLTPFRYAGSKNKLLPILTPYLTQIIDKQSQFADVFVGGGSVLLHVAELYPNLQLYCNDGDSDVSAFWQVISHSDSNYFIELLQLLNTTPTVERFFALKESSSSSIVEKAFKAIYLNRCSFSGILSSGPIGGKNQNSQWKIGCRYNFNLLKKKITYARHLLQDRTEVSNVSFEHYAPLTSAMPCYIDPPYLEKGDMLYPCKMTPEDHQHLAKLLANKLNWVLSYDDHPIVKELYRHKTIMSTNTNYCINGKKTSWNNKNELIILG